MSESGDGVLRADENQELIAIRSQELAAREQDLKLRLQELPLRKSENENNHAQAMRSIEAQEASDQRFHQFSMDRNKKRFVFFLAFSALASVVFSLMVFLVPPSSRIEIITLVLTHLFVGLGGFGGGGLYFSRRKND